MSFLTCTMPIQSPLCGPKARTKSWPASPASASARLIPRPRNLWHEPMLQDTRSPNLNSYAERWVRSVKEECLSRLILFGASSLRRALQQYIVHYHEERNHQGKSALPHHRGRPICDHYVESDASHFSRHSA